MKQKYIWITGIVLLAVFSVYFFTREAAAPEQTTQEQKETEEARLPVAETVAKTFMLDFVQLAPATADEAAKVRIYDMLSSNLKTRVSKESIASDLARVIGVQDVPDQGVGVNVVTVDGDVATVLLNLGYSGGDVLREVQLVWEEDTWKVDDVSVFDAPASGVVIDLSGEGLDTVPMHVFEQTDATKLDLSSNNLTGALQAEVRQLQNLEVLDLSDNNFTGVPAEVGQLTKLRVLDLSNNPITGLPYEIGNLNNLELLNLRGTQYNEQDLTVILQSLPENVEVRR